MPELDAVEFLLLDTTYDPVAARAARSYFPKEPKTNLDRCQCPPDLWTRSKAWAEANLPASVVTALSGDPTASVTARYFIIHDTADFAEYGLGAGQHNPGAKSSTAGIHLWISAKATYAQRGWGVKGYGTKMESGAANRHFLHVELGRDPALAAGATFYNDSQYDRLACAYLFASARKGRFLTVASHNEVDRACAIYDDEIGKFKDFGHHDPEKFDLARWYRRVADIAGLPADTTFGIEPARVNGKNQGGQKNVFIQFAKGLTDEVDQYGKVPTIPPTPSDSNQFKKIKHPSYGEYYDLPIYVIVGGERRLPRDVP